MVKSTNFLPEIFFNYLGEENSAIFLAYTNLYLKQSFDDGVVWLQTDENDHITSVVATGSNGKTLCFAQADADFCELSFILSNEITSADKLPFEQIDKKYLLRKRMDFAKCEKGINYKDYAKIKGLDGSDFNEKSDVVALKMFFNLKGVCEGAMISENDEAISGGFISFSDDFAIITDVFTKQEYRGKGYGKQLVKNLLNCSTKEVVYLTSKEHNVKFYEKLGFEVVKEIYEYRK
jgi:predicted GNAT family N-acyltransferase